MKWDSVMAKKGSPPPSSPLPTGPPSPFSVRPSTSRAASAWWWHRRIFFFFLAPSLGHALGHLVSCRVHVALRVAQRLRRLPCRRWWRLQMSMPREGRGGLVGTFGGHKNKSPPAPRPWAQDWAKFSVVSGSGQAHVDSRGSGDRKPGRDGLAWHKYVDTYLTC